VQRLKLWQGKESSQVTESTKRKAEFTTREKWKTGPNPKENGNGKKSSMRVEEGDV